jgi:hypothetical protein
MKNKLLTLLLVFVICLGMIAQTIPNNSFENWTSAGAYNTPDGWGNLNPSTVPGSTYTCLKQSAPNPINNYLDLSTQMSGANLMLGMAASGKIDPVTFRAYQGFPISSRPVSLTGSWEYMARSTDHGYASILLTKWNSGSGISDTVAYSKYIQSGMTMSWTTFSIPINYRTTGTPDSALIVFSASGTSPTVNSYLYVDDIAFSGLATGITQDEESIFNLNLYPIPAKDELNISFSTSEGENSVIQLLDILGNIVSEQISNSVSGSFQGFLQISSYSKGIYFLRIKSNKGSAIRKILID